MAASIDRLFKLKIVTKKIFMHDHNPQLEVIQLELVYASICTLNDLVIDVMTTPDTRQVVVDYINFQLRKKGLVWPGQLPPELTRETPVGKVEQTMRVLGEEFEQRYTQVFNDMCQQLHITPNNAQATFVTIINELFSDGIRWGRVVALFSFSGALSVQCVEKEMPVLVDQVVDWTVAYIEGHLMSWILQNGNWQGFVEFYEGAPERRSESPWPSFKTLCSYAVGALGVLTLGAILAHRS